jgi:hypothetical protein
MKLSARLQMQCELWATSFVANMFASFIPSGSRGPAFTWAKFPDMVARWASSRVHLDFPDFGDDNLTKRQVLKDFVSERAKQIAHRLVKEAEFV